MRFEIRRRFIKVASSLRARAGGFFRRRHTSSFKVRTGYEAGLEEFLRALGGVQNRERERPGEPIAEFGFRNADWKAACFSIRNPQSAIYNPETRSLTLAVL
jgi:hypothetical protein